MMRVFLPLLAAGSLLVAAAACDADPTRVCVYQLSDQFVSLSVGATDTVYNASSCIDTSTRPVSWTGKHPEVVTVTPLENNSRILLEAKARGVDTVTVNYVSGRNIILLVQVQ